MRDQENIDKGIAIGEEKTYLKIISSLLSDGHTEEEIAELLHISIEDVHKYMDQ